MGHRAPVASRRMRVALVCPYSCTVPGGVQTQVLGLARSLRARGDDVVVVAPADGAGVPVGLDAPSLGGAAFVEGRRQLPRVGQRLARPGLALAGDDGPHALGTAPVRARGRPRSRAIRPGTVACRGHVRAASHRRHLPSIRSRPRLSALRASRRRLVRSTRRQLCGLGGGRRHRPGLCRAALRSRRHHCERCRVEPAGLGGALAVDRPHRRFRRPSRTP